MSTMTVAEQIEMIIQATKMASKSKAAAEKFLINAGIKTEKSKVRNDRPAKKLTNHS